MPVLPRTTMEQWAILNMVMQQGGFAQAAAVLNRSQSSVSYAVARLQEGLGVPLLEIQGRRAVLTSAGHTLLAEARELIEDFQRLESRGRAIAAGESPMIRLVVDRLFPKTRLFAALAALAAQHPQVEVQLQETVKQTSPDPGQVRFDIAITMPAPGTRYGQRILEIDLMAVAHHTHPLAAKHRPISRATLARHLRVDISGDAPAAATAPSDGKVWRVSTVEAAHAAVGQGLCYGWLPRDLIAPELADGTLVPLPLTTGGIRKVPLDLTFANGDNPPPTVRLLADMLFPTETNPSQNGEEGAA